MCKCVFRKKKLSELKHELDNFTFRKVVAKVLM